MNLENLMIYSEEKKRDITTIIYKKIVIYNRKLENKNKSKLSSTIILRKKINVHV